MRRKVQHVYIAIFPWETHAFHTDLQAALEADPDNPEAKALLYQRSVAVEKVKVYCLPGLYF